MSTATAALAPRFSRFQRGQQCQLAGAPIFAAIAQNRVWRERDLLPALEQHLLECWKIDAASCPFSLV
ncbi:hypothetical protein [Blastomonas sp. SL216]|uniref:hypothetical protein n=1 Tax=Blastomonas sp. SL216 TaxID=2995169 RepID=UPI00237707BB|nr:hypothetical protein OU999_03175 [Blastomonas sp. SL216]